MNLKIDETMDGTMQAVGRAAEVKRVSTQEADRALSLVTHESTRVRSIREDMHALARRRPASTINGMKPEE